jgi:hypothetical protein
MSLSSQGMKERSEERCWSYWFTLSFRTRFAVLIEQLIKTKVPSGCPIPTRACVRRTWPQDIGAMGFGCLVAATGRHSGRVPVTRHKP